MSDLRLPAIVGVAEADAGGGKPALDVQAGTVVDALRQSGLQLRDVDGLAVTGIGSKFTASTVAESLGIQPTWFDSTHIGGASYELFVTHAAAAIALGTADVVVVAYGSDQRTGAKRTLSSAEPDKLPLRQFDVPYGPLLPVSAYALAAQRHMHEFGTTAQHLAEVAVAARHWARRNPAAHYFNSDPLTIDDVLNSPMVSSPLRKKDCCLVTDGGGAVVLTSLERARDLPPPPIRILGSGAVSTHRSIAAMPDLTDTGARASGKRAFTEAGLRPSDIDVVEIYDSFTITVLLTLEALGFCGRGESGPFVEGGTLGPNGTRPINTNGGGLAHCHPGMYGIFLIIEAVRQLRGEAGERQLPDAETAVCHGTGGYLGTHATVILGNDR